MFPPEHPLFMDHFPAAPCVPGTLVVASLQAKSAKHFPQWRVTGIQRFRFYSFIEPGQYTYSLTLHPENALIHCELRSATRRLAGGKLHIAPISGKLYDSIR